MKKDKTGCIATIDMSDFADGLYRFDISSNDKNGNSGFNPECCIENAEAYQSIFVVKNSQSPNANICWMESKSSKTSDYVFKNTASGTKNSTILRIGISDVRFGIKKIKVEVKDKDEKEIKPFEEGDEKIKVRYSASEVYSTLLSEAKIEANSENEIILKDYEMNFLQKGYLYIESGMYLGTEHGELKVTVTVTDLYGNEQNQELSLTAYNDQKEPNFKDEEDKDNFGFKTVDYKYPTGNGNEHVWPRPGKLGVLSTEFIGEEGKEPIKNTNAYPVRWFYTNARENNDYGVRLTWEVEEDRKNVYWEYIRSDYITNGNPLSDAKLSAAPNGSYTTGGYLTGTGGSMSYTFKPGLWHIRLRDEVGNVSKYVYSFVVVSDHASPANNLDNNKNIHLAMTLGNVENVTVTNDGTGDQRKYRNTSITSSDFYEFFDYGGHSYDYMDVNTITLKGKKEDVQNVTLNVSLTGNASGLIYWGEKNQTLETANAYAERKPSRTASGLVQYCFNWAWGDWNTSNHDQYKPAYPEQPNTGVVSARSWGGDYHYVTESYRSKYGTWEDYTPGTDISWKIYHNWGHETIDYKYLPPVTLFLKDGCGNMTWIKIDNPYSGYSDNYNFRWKFDYTD